MAELLKQAAEKEVDYKPEKDKDWKVPAIAMRGSNGERVDRFGGEGKGEVREAIFNKGQSRRIWGELYKVIDASDVVVQVRHQHVRPPRPTESTTMLALGMSVLD